MNSVYGLNMDDIKYGATAVHSMGCKSLKEFIDKYCTVEFEPAIQVTPSEIRAAIKRLNDWDSYKYEEDLIEELFKGENDE